MTDKRRLERMFRQHYGAMYRQACRMLGNDAESRDVVIDVFAQLLDGSDDLRDETLRSYLLTLTRNRCINLLVRRQREKAAVMVDIWQEDEEEQEQLEALYRFIDERLSRDYRDMSLSKVLEDLNASLLRRESENDLSQQEYSKELGDRPITTVNKEKNTMAAGKLILTYPVWKGELSVGSEAISTRSHGNNRNQEGIIPEADIEMREKNIACFAEYGLQLGHWRLSGGLRYEHVATDYHSFGEYQEEPSRTYDDWFPSLSAAWQKGKWSAQLGYGKRITRPPYAMLCSMIVYDSRMFYEGGNPLLRPSIRQSIDLNLTYSWLTFSAGFTREHDLFSHIAQVYDEENEIAIFRPTNFDHQDRVYATLVASPKLDFWQPTFVLHYYQQMFDAEAYGVPKKMNKPEFSFDVKNWFVLNPTTKALLQASYTGSNHWAFMYRGSNFILNARLQKSFWDGRLTAALYANDIFRTCRNKLTTYYAIGSTVQDIYNYTQQVGLTLSYSINATRSKYRGTGAGNDEKNRL